MMQLLDAKTRELETALAQWQAHLLPLVERKVSAAHAHGVAALTDSLKRTADGRPTIKRLNRSPSFQAAVERLEELLRLMTGRSELSLKGKIRDAREAFLRTSLKMHVPMIPAELRSRAEPEPTQLELAMIRAAAPHGHDARKMLEGPIRGAQLDLKRTVVKAAGRSTPEHVETDLLDRWKRSQTERLSQAIRSLLIDSMHVADNEGGIAMIDPKFLERSFT